MKQVLKIGIPVALQDGFIQIAFIVITVIANRRGLNDAAAVGIVEKLIGIVFLVPSTMLSAVSALSAQNIGAGKPERAISNSEVRGDDFRGIRVYSSSAYTVCFSAGCKAVY